MGKTGANPYGSRVLPNGHSNSTYSTSEYVDSLSSFKRNAAIAGGRPGAINNIKNRQQVPTDGASCLNPPRSPRFSDRYRSPVVTSNPVAAVLPPDTAGDWFENKDEEEVAEESRSVSRYSRGSGRGSENRSVYSGGSSWSSRPKSRTSPATEL